VIDAVNLARQLGHDHIGTTVVVIVLKYHTHARKAPSILGKSCAGFKA
jgi:hypothetical protein